MQKIAYCLTIDFNYYFENKCTKNKMHYGTIIIVIEMLSKLSNFLIRVCVFIM